MQSSVLALIFDGKPSSWNVKLLTIIYCGFVDSAIFHYLHTWCISKKGPVFTGMFTLLLLVIVANFSAFVFAELLLLGRSVPCSLIGALLIIIGLFCMLWRKSIDSYVPENLLSTKSSLHDHQTVFVISITGKPATVPTTSEKNSRCLG